MNGYPLASYRMVAHLGTSSDIPNRLFHDDELVDRAALTIDSSSSRRHHQPCLVGNILVCAATAASLTAARLLAVLSFVTRCLCLTSLMRAVTSFPGWRNQPQQVAGPVCQLSNPRSLARVESAVRE